MEIKLICARQEIRIRLMSDRRYLYGTVIGTNDGIVGILMDTGEYIDIPQENVRKCSMCCLPEKRTENKNQECRLDSRHCTRRKLTEKGVTRD